MKKQLKKIFNLALISTPLIISVACTKVPETITNPDPDPGIRDITPPPTNPGGSNNQQPTPPTITLPGNPNKLNETKVNELKKLQNSKTLLNWGDESFAQKVRSQNLTNLTYSDEATNVASIAPFNKEAKRSNVMYQLTVYSFADGNNDGIGDFIGLKNNLDYFVNLGIDTLYLSPIHPASSYHGYDVIDYTDVAPELGGMQAFDEFLTAAHAKGIRVVIDVVINHTSYEHPWFQKALQGDPKYKNYYYMYDKNSDGHAKEGTDDIRQNFIYVNEPGKNIPNTDYKWAAEFWSGMPDLNLKNPELLQEMLNVHKFWAAKGVDGFRYDAFYHFFDSENIYKNTSNKGLEVDLMAEFRKVIEQEYLKANQNNISRSSETAFMFGEWWGSSSDDKAKGNWFSKTGQKALSSLIDGTKWKDDVNNVWIHPGDELNLIKSLTDYKGQKREWIPFLDNHDVERWINKFKWQLRETEVNDEPHKLTDKERYRYISAIFSLLSRGGLPTLYNGNEILMQGGPKSDDDTKVREAYYWNDPKKTVYFKEAKNDAVVVQTGASVGEGSIESITSDQSSSYNLISKLIQLRQNYISLREMDEKYIWWDLDKVLEFSGNDNDFKGHNTTLRLNEDGTLILILYSDSLENESRISLNSNYYVKEKLLGENFRHTTENNKDSIIATGKGKFGAYLIAPR